jgi:predicted Na+-dependent transporter
MDKDNQGINKKIFKASLVSLVLCIGLIIVARIAQNNEQLEQAFVLVFTSNIITVVYLFGLRYWIKKLYKK